VRYRFKFEGNVRGCGEAVDEAVGKAGETEQRHGSALCMNLGKYMGDDLSLNF
jgi:hypothetical protein